MTAPVVALVDAGTGRSSSWGMGPINVQQCGRTGCKTMAAAGFSFCAPCLAWLRCDTNDDPLKADQRSL